MGLERCIDELLDQPADRVAIGAHAALFDDNVTLFVELPLDGVADALAFEVGPEFQTI
jgi:hypothetical protein